MGDPAGYPPLPQYRRAPDLTPTELDSILTQLAEAGVIKRGKTTVRLTTWGRELLKRAGKT